LVGAIRVASKARGLNISNDCSVRNKSPVLKSLYRMLWDPNGEKADVSIVEETGKCTIGTHRVGVKASSERPKEITSGRAYFQQGPVATYRD
jgi:hypothetical protein